MKLWWSRDKAEHKQDVDTRSKQNGPQNSEVRLLEDQPPKFEDSGPSIDALRPKLSKVLQSIGVDDFKNVTQMACFRDAFLTGLGIGATVGVISIASRRSGSSAFNWGFGSFIVGTVVSWEQCRVRMYKSRMNMRMAQNAYKDRKTDGEQGGAPPQ